jgi:hypothetical protein
MSLNVKFKSKIFLSTPRYAAQRGVDFALCRIVGSRQSALCRVAQSCDARSRESPLCGIAQSRFSSSNLFEYLSQFESICKTVLAHESGDPGVQFNEKRGSKISQDCPFKILIFYSNSPRQSIANFVPALCCIAQERLSDVSLDHCPSLWLIALAENGIALGQMTKVWSRAAFVKGTIYQKIVHR